MPLPSLVELSLKSLAAHPGEIYNLEGCPEEVILLLFKVCLAARACARVPPLALSRAREKLATTLPTTCGLLFAESRRGGGADAAAIGRL